MTVPESLIMESSKVESARNPNQKVGRGSGWLRSRWLVFAGLALALVGGGAFYWSRSSQALTKRDDKASANGQQDASRVPVVQVIKPHRGGMKRLTDQPGTIRGFEYAPLYAKVSGYLKALNVDRGDRVKKGQVLAQVYDPELDVAVLQAEASLQHSQAVARQAEARLKSAEAGVQAAEAKRTQATCILEEAVAQRIYRGKALDRLTELARRNAVEQRLVDEQEDQYRGSIASEHAAQSGIQTADAQLAEAKAAVELAQADLVTAQAEIAVSEANLKKAKVFLEYTRIEAPFEGVITTRGEGVHPGAFIRAATEGTIEPLLTVSRTDKFRTIVEIPDTDVPFCDPGDPATVRVSTLAGRVFKGTVSRVAYAEDLKNRTMRVEIDLLNPDGVLRDGMYGKALIELEPPSNNLTVPATCLIEKDRKNEGAVFVVRGGKVERVPIRVGKDSGVEVEVLSGLTEKDEVIAQITPSIGAGSEVKAVPANVDKKKDSSE